MLEPTAATSESGRIAALVIECLERVDREGEVALDAFCDAHPEHATVIRERVEILRDAGLLELSNDDEVRDFPERLGEFRLLERLGVGGMGVVYGALQESLDRTVALKLIRPEMLYFPMARERFQREIMTIARLQHPGIVPIYSVGEESGVPFFAMELVQGATLADALAALEQRDPALLSGSDLDRAIATCTKDPPGERELSELFQGTWPDVCLRIMREVCEALEHAHRRGVVHRDLKPSNVMITRDGRVMLLDFGLSSSAEVPRLTRTGSFMGSLPYASPERLEDATTESDRESDIYALGVTLYELLTLRLPYCGKNELELRESILNAGPEPVRRLNPRVSWDADTVCRVAMDPDPARRYPSPELFGRDLGNVLEQRPIEARRSGALLRARRWSRRHPAWVVGAALGTLLVVGGPSVYAWQQWKLTNVVQAKNVELEGANDALSDALLLAGQQERLANEQRDLARANLFTAVEAIDDFVLNLGAVDLEQVPQMGPLQRRLLELALVFYDGFLEQDASDRRLRAGRINAVRELGRIQHALGDTRASIEALRMSVELLEGFCAEDPSDYRAHLELAVALRQLALSLGGVGEREEQTAVSTYALQVYEELREAHPDDPDLACDTASFYCRRGQAERRDGNLDDAERWFGQACDLLEGIHARFPENPGYVVNLSDALRDRGGVLADLGRYDEVEEPVIRSIELARLAVSLSPTKTLRRSHARALTVLAAFYERTGRSDEAVALHLEMAEIVASLLADYPNLSYHHTDHLTALGNLARMYLEDQGDLAAATAVLDRAEPAAEEALRRFPEVLGLRARAASITRHRSLLARMSGRFDDSRQLLEQALEELRFVLDQDPQQPGARERLIRWSAERAEICLLTESWDDVPRAIRAYVAEDPKSVDVRLTAASYCVRTARAVEEAANVGEDERRALVDECLGELRLTLRAAFDLGFDDTGPLDSDDGFAELRKDPVFRQALAEIGK